MTERLVTIRNPEGLHARPVAHFVAETRNYVSTLKLTDPHTGQWADAKSILMVLALRLPAGAQVLLSADGPDEAQAVEALAALLERESD